LAAQLPLRAVGDSIPGTIIVFSCQVPRDKFFLLQLICIEIISTIITYELLSHAIERSNNIVSLFKELENIRIDA
jgi:hypothetical protein